MTRTSMRQRTFFQRFGDRLRAWFRPRSQATTVTSAGLNDLKFLEWLGIDPDEINIRGEKGLREATVYACVKILSEAVAKLPLKVYREGPRGAEKATDHYLYSLLKIRPNPYMTAYDMFKAVEAQRNLFGNAYIVPEFITSGPARGRIRWLWPVDARAVQIWVDNRGLFEAKNRVWYILARNS